MRQVAVDKAQLTPYEGEQVEQIATWKSKPPNPWSELWKMITLPVARAFERVTPDWLVAAGIAKSYDAAKVVAWEQDIKLRAACRRPCRTAESAARRV